ncbi:GNAT family N-acetyltransferase [Parvicella tangerina]|uniref:N-acetyltransferase domain-containing protein n=1 Tax=Parvicella tangerina TaxID=2829795 RepID=A0A916JP00_9FLAO|nr:GNAT family N-acetyltransferase [Parvicella tangerina]CAG5081904.1 hypothetical protein CRYO30217_01758 [Parvicella tangerina]
MIRRIKLEDNAACASMIRGVFEELEAATAGTVYEDPTTDSLFELFDRDDAVFYVLELDGVIHGSCGVFPTKGLPEGVAELVKYYVSGTVRGKGYGKQLMEICEEKAKEMGYRQLYIESTEDFKDAVRIYEKIGYRQLGRALGDSGHDGCPIWMLKTL